MTIPFKKLLLVFLLPFAINLKGYSQNQSVLKIVESSPSGEKKISEKKFTDLAKRENYLKRHLLSIYEKGHLNASVDSIQTFNNLQIAYLSKGAIFNYARIGPGNVDLKLLRRIRYRDKIFDNRPLNPVKLSQLFNDILTQLENNGYPFASLALENLRLQDRMLSGDLVLKKNKLVKIDSIIIKGDAEIPRHVVLRQIGVFQGDIYNQNILDNISLKIEQTPYLEEIKNYEILFTEDKTALFLYLKKRKSNSFNGVIGIQPNDKTGKIGFTGELNALLKNSLKKGETFIFDWRRLVNQTQNLQLGLAFPYLFKSPFSTAADFKLFKKDSTFLSVTEELDINLHQKNNDYLSLELQFYNTSLLNTESIIPNNNNILEWADIQMISYGLGYTKVNLNYLPNPTAGYKMAFHFKTGRKKIKENAELLQKDPDIYNELDLSTNQYSTDLRGEIYIPLFKFSTLKTAVYAGKIINSRIFFNEMYRIGGLKTLRGFDEESIFATTFSIFTFEYRFILDKNSAIFAFSDLAYYESILNNEQIKDKPIGIGMGIDFETKAGIFSMVYALGKQFNNPFILRSGKVHFGIKSTF